MSDLVLRVLPNGQVLARNCKVCGKVFGLVRFLWQITCSRDCATKYRRRRKNEKVKRRRIANHDQYLEYQRRRYQRDRERRLEQSRKTKTQIKIANEIYASLMGEVKPQPVITTITPNHCVICDIEISARGRWLTCSETCSKIRALERNRAYSHGDYLERMKSSLSYRQIKAIYRARYKIRHPDHKKASGGRNRASDHKRQAIYQAFRSMGLLPTNRENDDGAYRSRSDGSQAAVMAQGQPARPPAQDL